MDFSMRLELFMAVTMKILIFLYVMPCRGTCCLHLHGRRVCWVWKCGDFPVPAISSLKTIISTFSALLGSDPLSDQYSLCFSLLLSVYSVILSLSSHLHNFHSPIVLSSTLKMDAGGSSETAANIYQPAWCHISEYSNFQISLVPTSGYQLPEREVQTPFTSM
jgi:hypothetical protein